jgi:hypothetical protein
MKRSDAERALAYAASDAYANEAENTRLIDEVLVQLGERAQVSEHEFAQLVQRFRSVLATNRTAPGVMKIMALADETRRSSNEALTARRRRERRFFEKHAEHTRTELLRLVATTLDALATEPF